MEWALGTELIEIDGAGALSSYKQKSFIKIVGGQFSFPFVLTARQYGEVVLPDVASGQSPGTPPKRGQKTVTVQGGYGALFAVRVQSWLSITSVALQV
jgi:hypothetical protein